MSIFSFRNIEKLEGGPVRIMLQSRTRICIYCGNKTKREIKTVDTNFKGTKEVFRFCCLTCGKEVSPYTQLDYEDNEKRLSKIYNRLLQYVKPEQIKKVYLDHDNNILNVFDLEKVYKFLFIVNIGEKVFEIPCSYTKRLVRYYESPIGIKKDKGFKKAFNELKKYVVSFQHKN